MMDNLPVLPAAMEVPTVKVLALAFLIMVGGALLAEGLHFHLPKGYL